MFRFLGRLPRAGESGRYDNTRVRILGVIDLRNGLAVHARGGERHRYRPVQPGNGDALALAHRYLDAGVTDLYVADLDAIEGHLSHQALVSEVSRLGMPVWLDAGASTVESARDCIESGPSRVIVGLETLTSFDRLAEICEDVGSTHVAFSLDLRDGLPIVPALAEPIPDAITAVARAAAAGVEALIILDLGRVGMRQGLDLTLIRNVHEFGPAVTLFAGGGIRGADDLAALEAAGCDGALIATAFHDGSLDRALIVPFTSHEYRTANRRAEPEHEPRTENREQ